MSEAREIRLELLHGRKVRDAAGEVVGTLFEIVAERRTTQCVITEFHLGTGALLERLGMTNQKPIRVPWELMDLSDPEKPRVRCLARELG